MSQLELFNYEKLAPDVAILAQTAAERIKLRMKRTAEDIIEIGKDLNAMKALLPHGQFLPWIASEFEMNHKTATSFMNVASRFGDKLVNFTTFKPSILYELAAPSTPDEVVDEALDKTQKGEKVTNKQIKELKAKFNEEKAALQREKGDLFQKVQDLTVRVNQLNEAKKKAEEIAQSSIQDAQAKLEAEKQAIAAEREKIKSELEKTKKALDNLKANPDPETRQKIKELQREYNELLDKHETQKAEVNRITFELDNLKTKEDQALKASLDLAAFHKAFKKLIADHPDALIAMSSPYLDGRQIAEVEALADTLNQWGTTISQSVYLARESQATAVESVEVEVLGA